MEVALRPTRQFDETECTQRTRRIDVPVPPCNACNEYLKLIGEKKRADVSRVIGYEASRRRRLVLQRKGPVRLCDDDADESPSR